MNKLTSTLLFTAALLLGGCTHASTQTAPVVAAAPPVVVATAPTPAPVDQPDDGPQAHQAPFTGKTWTVSEVSPNWIGMESQDGAGLIAINPSEGAKVILVSEPTEKTLTVFATDVKTNLTAHGVKFIGQKNVKVDGVPAVQFTTSQDTLRVWVTLAKSGTNAYLFGCAGLASNAAAAKVCSDVRGGLHFAK